MILLLLWLPLLLGTLGYLIRGISSVPIYYDIRPQFCFALPAQYSEVRIFQGLRVDDGLAFATLPR
jgi:hypothetical protein